MTTPPATSTATTSAAAADVTRSTGHVILRCRDCKAAGRRDYTITRTLRERLGRPSVTQTAEIAGQSITLRDRYDLDRALSTPCPACHSPHVNVIRIKGTYVADRTCDDRCMSAVGPACSCSCGGENHGGGHSAW